MAASNDDHGRVLVAAPRLSPPAGLLQRFLFLWHRNQKFTILLYSQLPGGPGKIRTSGTRDAAAEALRNWGMAPPKEPKDDRGTCAFQSWILNVFVSGLALSTPFIYPLYCLA